MISSPQSSQGSPASQTKVLALSLIGLMNDLSSIIKQESDMLDQQNFKNHAELLKTKQKMTLDYRATMKSFIAQPQTLKDLEEPLRSDIRQAAQKLADVTDRNARLLRASVLGVQRLLQTIIRMVKDDKLVKPAYDNPTTQHLKLGTYSPTCTPIAVTRTA